MSGYQTLRFQIMGAAPFLAHNGQLADPLNRYSRLLAEISAKRAKTPADHEEMARREWYGGLYVGADGTPCVPAEMLEAVIIAGAKKHKRGPQAKAGIIVPEAARLDYDGPRHPDALWADQRFRLRVGVKVGQGRLMRTRPRFDGWSARFAVRFLADMIDARYVHAALVVAGEQIGIGDWRPRFGRFTVEELPA